ncbi:MAG: RNA polymerase sigma factor [Candidatus Eiseniibacteriota bacterium]
MKPETADPSDSDLVARAQGGDTEAFGELVRRYEGRIYHLVRRILGDPDEAEDALQETFLSAFRGLPRFKREARFSTWLFRIATNAALMRVRKRRPNVVSLDRPIEEEDGGEIGPRELRDWSAMPDEELVNDETRTKMEEAIAALPEDQRAVFLLRDVEGLSNPEIAETLELTLPAVKSRLHRARLSLRNRLDRYLADREQPERRGGGRGTA